MVISSYFSAWTVIMEFHNQRDADSAWEYGRTADSDIETGVKAAGTSGQWSIGGPGHVGNTLGASIRGSTPQDYDYRPISSFRFARGAWSCNGNQFIIPSTWNGGISHTAVGVTGKGCFSAPQNQWMLYHSKGTSFSRYYNRASRMNGAVNLGPITVGATSGYSVNVAMSWTWARNYGYLCGNNGYETSAGIIYVS